MHPDELREPAVRSPVQSEEDGDASPPSAMDTHCHLFLMQDDPARVIAEARLGGVDRLLCVGIDPESSRRSAELAQSFQGVFATAGVHPHTASEFDRAAGSTVELLLTDPMVVGVGETGLDYYRKLSPVEDQQRAFRTHIALSRETGKPLIVHVREAWEDALRILAEEEAEAAVLHCFSGDEAEAKEAEARGYFVSFSGNVTYPNAGAIRRAAAALAPDRILAETDSPFLPPQHLRGRSNHPANVRSVLGRLAELRGVTLDQMIIQTATNARVAFSLQR